MEQYKQGEFASGSTVLPFVFFLNKEPGFMILLASCLSAAVSLLLFVITEDCPGGHACRRVLQYFADLT